jgi:hypothetical protein
MLLRPYGLPLSLPSLFLSDNMKIIRQSSPVTGLEWPRGLQEVKVSRFHDNGTGWW